jgi:prepilin-type processing-associated H-X9-DG protein
MVEVDLSNAVWRKRRHSASNGRVEIAFVDGHVAVRDSEDRQGPVLVFTPVEWDAFVAGVRDGELTGP